MCGIAGHVTNGPRPDRAAVEAATNRLAHRGPNDGRVVEFNTACLGHRRLSIIDIEGSRQPLASEDGRYTIVFNGEIYNYLELRKELSGSFHFRTQGDTEVLLALYIRDGEKCLEKLNGMFAFAVWDNTAQRLFIARDRVGKKPLFYSLFDGGIAFSSELDSLLAFTKIDRAIDPEAVQDFFAYQFIPAPRSIYRSVRKLPAAHWLTFDGGKVTIKRYWRPPFPSEATAAEPQLHEELSALLEDAVRLRLRSDVPLGAFLSGGLDSSIIVGLMTKQGVNVNSFHVGFEEESFDETVHAKAAATHFGTIHHSQTLPLDVTGVLDTMVRHFGEPFADPSAVPTWHLCRYTRRGITVALSGDGADEIFAGYRRYYARQLISRYFGALGPLRRLVYRSLLSVLSDSQAYYGTSFTKKLRLLLELADRSENDPNDLLAQLFPRDERRALLASSVSVNGNDHVAEFELYGVDDVSRMMLADIQSYLPDDILTKVDRMSMAHALEVRSPFLDYRVVEFACRLPLSQKLNGASQKHIVRRTFGHLLPPELINREKHGFAVPLGRWFSTILKKDFEDSVLSAPAVDWIKADTVARLWREHTSGRFDHGFKLWSLFVFHRWYHSQRA